MLITGYTPSTGSGWAYSRVRHDFCLSRFNNGQHHLTLCLRNLSFQNGTMNLFKSTFLLYTWQVFTISLSSQRCLRISGFPSCRLLWILVKMATNHSFTCLSIFLTWSPVSMRMCQQHNEIGLDWMPSHSSLMILIWHKFFSFLIV